MEKQILSSREISMLTLHWYLFSRFALGLYFLTSEKKDNAVKLRQYLLLKRDAFRLYSDWNKLMINQ